MKKLRIAVFTHEDLIPPEKVDGIDIVSAPWRTEYDVITTIRKLGHEAFPVGLRSDLGVIRNVIEEHKPHLVFNLLEEFDGVGIFDQNVISFLELLHVPYTGCNPRALMLCRDKALCKKILSYHRIPSPDFVVFPIGRRVKRPKRLGFPLIVKSLIEEASLGISQSSVVYSDEELVERCRFIHEKIQTDALVEEFIDGRELYVSVIGNSRVQALPVWELYFNNMPENAERIATASVKWDVNYQKRRGIESGEAKDVSEEKKREILQLSKRIFRVLGMNGYARIDFRMKENGDIFVLEANANPQIARGEDFANSAKCAGISYKELIQKILNLGLRWSVNRGG